MAEHLPNVYEARGLTPRTTLREDDVADPGYPEPSAAAYVTPESRTWYMYYRLPFHIDGATFLHRLTKYHIIPQNVPSSNIFYWLPPHFQMLCNKQLPFVSQDTEIKLIASLIFILCFTLPSILHLPSSLLPPSSSSALLTSVMMLNPTVLPGFPLPYL